MTGIYWGLLGAYASFLNCLDRQKEAQYLTLVLHPLEPSGRDLSEATSALEGRELIDGYWLTLQGFTAAKGMAKETSQ